MNKRGLDPKIETKNRLEREDGHNKLGRLGRVMESGEIS